MKYCCTEFKRWKELGWFFAPDYYQGEWHINTGTSASYDIRISHCPFCGSKLEEK